METVSKGVCAAKGFLANGVHCGIRAGRSKKDLSLIFSEVPAAAAAVYTTNLVKGAPLTVTKKHLENGYARAIICNSGNANTCNANGIEISEGMCSLAAEALGISSEDVLVASTGVIGEPLSLAPVAAGVPGLVAGLSYDGGMSAEEGIMTTDTRPKLSDVSFMLGGKTCRLGGIAKGSGMIHPNMATMLVFLTTDAAISPAMLQKALSETVPDTFNMISVDGDTSTNDNVIVLANGLAGNPLITEADAEYAVFAEALRAVMTSLSRMIAGDGEGATKLLVCKVDGAADKATAVTVSKSVICSSLVKTAMFGADANWGRILCAIGYSGADVDVTKIGVSFESASGSMTVCENGAGIGFDEELGKKILSEKEIDILIRLNSGAASATAYGCDLTYEYVKINGDYRT